MMEKKAVYFKITDEDRALAKERAEKQKKESRKKDPEGIQDSDSKFFRGALGVILVEKFLGPDLVKFDDTFDNDLLVKNIIKLEVKEQSLDKGKPYDHYAFDIVKRWYKQKCDFVAYVLINSECTEGCVLGFRSEEATFNPSRIQKAGSINPHNGVVMKNPNYHCQFWEIGDPEEYKKFFYN